MQRFKRLFSAFLACAIMLGMAAAPIPAEAATTDYELVFLDEIKKLTPGETFDPAAAETVTSANKGDIVVLTVAFNNKSSSPATLNSFSLPTNYDSERLTPYVGTAPFNEPSTYFAASSSFSGWMIASNANTAGAVNVSGMSMAPATAAPGETVLGYMAFSVNADATDGQAQFAFGERASVGSYALSDFNPITLTIGNGGSSTDPTAPTDDEPETPAVVTDYELVFLEDIKKLTPETAFDPETAETVTSANKGDIVVLTVAFNNKSSANATINSFSSPTNYDSTRLTPYVGTAPFNEPSTYFAASSSFSGWMIASNANTAGTVNVSGMSMSPATAAPGETVLGYMAFRVNDDAEDGRAAFKFGERASVGSYDLTSFLSRKLWIGEPPAAVEVDSVTVTAAPEEVAVPDSSAEPATASFTAQAKDQSGNVITGQTFTWTWDGDGKFEGVTFTPATATAPATVTVAPGAAVTKDETVTVTATSGGKSGTATLTIHPNGAPSDTLTVTVTDADDKAVTTVTPNGETQTFTASVNAPEGAEASWDVTDADGKSVNQDEVGVKVNADDGTVTVAADAKPGQYRIKATVGEQSANASLTVAEAVTSLTLSPKQGTIVVSADDDETLSFTAVNQNNRAVDPASLTWTLVGDVPESVEINNGIVKVPKGTAISATSGQVVVTVRAEAAADVFNTAQLTISNTPIVIELDHVEINGKAESETVTVSETEPVEVTAYAIDQNGNRIQTGVTWTLRPTGNGVVIDRDSGAITIPANPSDTAITAYTVTATYNGDAENAKSITLTLQKPAEYGISLIVNGQEPIETTIDVPGLNDADPAESVPFSAIDTETGEIIKTGIAWSVTENDFGMPGDAVDPRYVAPEITDGVLTLKVYRLAATDEWIPSGSAGLTGKSLLVTATRQSDNKSASAIIIVRRAEPVFSRVKLSYNDGESETPTEVVTGGQPIHLTVDGSTTQALTAVAQDQYEQTMTGAFTWTVWTIRADGSKQDQPGNGVTVAGSSAQVPVTVSGSARVGTYSVEAAQGDTTHAVTLTVSQADEQRVANLTLSEGQNEIEIPGKDESAIRSAPFRALALNQYGNVMSDEPIAWTITDENGSEVPGLTVENGVVVVDYAAKEAVADTVGRYFTVSATAGADEETGEAGISRTTRILVKRAPAYLNSITLNGQDSSQNVTVSLDGGDDITVQGEAWDQYESPIAAQTWSVSSLGFGSGVTPDSSTGVITVSKDATPGNYNVSAALNSRSAGPNLLIVSRGTPVPTRALISGGQASVTIPGDGQSPAPAAQAYTAIVKDQFNSDMVNQTIAWSITDENGALVSGISIEDGVVIVANEAKSFIPAGTWKSMKVRASCGSITSDPVDIYVRRADSVLTQVRIDSPLVENDITVIEYDGAGEKSVAAAALDQYGEIFNGASWELTSYNTSGVSVNQSGTILINSSAADGVVHTLTAKYGAQSPSATFRIKKVASSGVTLDSVTLTPTTVGIPSGAQATAFNGDGQEIRYGITWSAHPENQGVSVGNDGRIYVSSEAKADNYVILAQPDGVSVLGTPKSATLSVETAPPPTVTLSRVELLRDTLTVNGTSGASTQAVAYDTNGAPITSGVTWSITPRDGEVTIDSASGEITASKSAVGGEYVITGERGGVSRTATLTVRNETPATLANVMLSPATVTVDGTNGATSSARAVDSNNRTLTSGVTWSVSPVGQGVEVNSSGEITVTANTESGNYDITASYEGVNRSASLRVNSSAPIDVTVTLSTVTVSPTNVTVDGVSGQTATATANGSNNQPITEGVTWSVAPENQGVSINETSGAITVTANATGANYSVSATHNGTTRSATFHVTNTSSSEPNPPPTPPVTDEYTVTVNPAAVTVNGSAAQTAQASATTANNAAVTGGIVWSVTPGGNGVSIDAASGKVTVAATAAGGTYTVMGARGAESHSASLTVTNNTPPTLSSVSLNPAAVTLSGQAATSDATAISSSNGVLSSGVTWSVSPSGDGVSINAASGEIAVAATALAGTYTVSATYQTTTRSAALIVTGGADVEYEETDVDTAAAEIANTPLRTLSYSATGVKSAADQAQLKRAALAVPTVKQAVETPAAGTETEVRVTIEIKPKSYNPFVVSVTPMYEVIQKSGDTETTLSKEALSELSEPVTVSLNVPAGSDAAFAKHTHNGVDYYEPISYGGTTANPVASWTQRYFSDVELTKDAVTITFNPNGVTTTGASVTGASVTPATRSVTLGGKLDSLPTPTAPAVAGYAFTFNGWYLNNERVDLNSIFTKAETLVAHWVQTATSNGNTGGGGGSGGGGGGSSSGGGGSSSSSSSRSSSITYTVTLSNAVGGNLSASAKKATAGTTITIVPTPNAGYALNTLTVKTRTGTQVDVSSSAGTYSFEMPKASVTVTAEFTRNASSNTDDGNTTGNNSGNNGNNGNTTPTPSYSSISFVDMPSDNFFYTAVRWAVERGITNGTTATTFSPNQACTRAQMVMFLWRSQGMPMPSASYSPFVDVDPGANYYTAMLWAVERGITNGTTATTFEPYAACTRAQMVMFLHRVAGRPTPTQTSCPFTDITVGENYYVPMLWALETGITNGTTATTFSPYQACTRAQMVMFLYRYLGGN